MKQILTLFAIFYFLFAGVQNQTNAQTATPTQAENQGQVEVTAVVTGITLNISGFVAPFAEVFLIIDDVTVASSTADSSGDFSFQNISVRGNLSSACFEAKDAENLGTSFSCLSFSPLTENASFQNVFLPPTLGVSKDEISEGTSAKIYGYSIPQASVDLNISSIPTFAVSANSNGYYEFEFKNPALGSYYLTAGALLGTTKSLTPIRGLTLEVAPLAQASEEIEDSAQFGNEQEKRSEPISEARETLERIDFALAETNMGLIPLAILWTILLFAIFALLARYKWAPWMEKLKEKLFSTRQIETPENHPKL